MRRSSRIAVTGAMGLIVLLGAADPAVATPVPAPDQAGPRAGAGAGAGVLDESDLPVSAADVTTSDDDLRSTQDEVTVLTDRGDGAPVVTKLRTGSAGAAKRLAAKLDRRAGVVAARTRAVRAMAVAPDPLLGLQSNLRAIGAQGAWRWTAGKGIKVAVVDSGVDAGHPDLAGRVTAEIDLVPGGPTDPARAVHGTRVASIIAAGRNPVGIAGVAPTATIMPVTALDADGVGDTSTVARAIIAAANSGARVINLSLGGPQRDPVLDRAARYAYNRGAIVVAAAGNSFADDNLPQYPAASPTVVGVGSVDAAGTTSLFSNTGSYVDLAAPGEGILAAVPRRGYGRGTGTSYSAPQVSGTLALLTAMLPTYRPAALIRLALLTAQDDITSDGHDHETGYGVIRADRAVFAAAVLRGRPELARAPVRVTRLNASPEPVRAGSAIAIRVRLQTLIPNDRWRRSPIPYQVRIEFKADGSAAYQPVTVVAARAGRASVRVVTKQSGRWRARVRTPTGGWVRSGADHVAVVR